MSKPRPNATTHFKSKFPGSQLSRLIKPEKPSFSYFFRLLKVQRSLLFARLYAIHEETSINLWFVPNASTHSTYIVVYKTNKEYT